jgi:outer membrane lipoprotein-sorting protein
MRFLALALVCAIGFVPLRVSAQGAEALEGLSADEVVRRLEDAMRGETAHMKAIMTITTPRWTRRVAFRSWDDRRNDRSLTRILDPKKDRGTGFLRVEGNLWTYLPRVERITRIPPSMMLQSWMGSDFTNDDIARESSMIDDYIPELLGAKEIDGRTALGVALVPREEAPVVWSKLELWMVEETYAPLLYIYYDEPLEGKLEVVRRMVFSDIRDVAGRPFPHRWSLESVDKPGHSTEVVIEEASLDAEMDDSLFTQRTLKRSEAVR